MKPYLKLCEGLSGREFTLADAQKKLGTQPGSAKVIMSRMKSAGLVLPIGRGKYRLIRQENLVKLGELRAKDEKLYQLALEIFKRYPDLKVLTLYGSRISPTADALSDYDIMVIAETTHERSESRRIERELGECLGIKVHLTVLSEKGFKILAITEPHLKFWLNGAVILTEGWELGPLPPTAKWGYKEALYMAEGYIDVGTEEHDPFSATCYLTALKLILMVEHALNLDYNYENVRREMERLVGSNLIQAVRKDRTSPKGVRKEQLKKLKRVVLKRLRAARERLEMIGENESDLRWKELRR